MDQEKIIPNHYSNNSKILFFKYLFNYVYIYDCVYVCMSKVTVKDKRDLNPQELELQVVVSQPWVLKIEI